MIDRNAIPFALTFSLSMIVALAVATPRPARGEEPRTSVRFSAGGLLTAAPEFELVSPGEGMPTLAATVGFRLLSDLKDLELEVGLAYAGTRATAFRSTSSGLRLLTLELTAAYRLALWQVLGLSIRGGLLGDLGRLQLEDQASGGRFRGASASFGLEGLAGLSIRVPVGGRRGVPASQAFRLGLEAGYRWRPLPMAFHHLSRKTARETDPPRIALAKIDAGTLGLSSVVVQVSAGLAF